MNIYPAIDLKGGKCVRLSQGQFEQVTTYTEDPIKIAKRWQAEGALRLHIVDLDGARMGNPTPQNLDIVRHIIRQVGVPIQFGGGVRSAEVVERLLRIGIARVIVSTVAVRDAPVAQGIFTAYGDQVAVAVDTRNGMLAVQGWQQTTVESGIEFAHRMVKLGAKRFIFTDIARDGMLEGINLQAIAQMAAAVPGLPVIASGGVTTLSDIDALEDLRAASYPNLEGIIIGKALYAGKLRLPDVLARINPAER